MDLIRDKDGHLHKEKICLPSSGSVLQMPTDAAKNVTAFAL